MTKVGRNEKCPCGSNKKYKRCCINQQPIAFEGVTHRLSGTTVPLETNKKNLYQRNIEFIDTVIDVVRLQNFDSWADMKRQFSRDHVKEIYRQLTFLWQPSTAIDKLLTFPENELKALYVGDMRPSTVKQSIIRHSLYCDKILVVNPFMNAWCTAEEYNPLVHPELWVEDTLKWTHFLMQLMPWVLSGHVVLIPDPGDYNYKLRTSTWDQAKIRNDGYSADVQKLFKIPDDSAEEEMWRFQLLKSDEEIVSDIREKKPNASDTEIKKALEYLHNERDKHPTIPTNPLETRQSSMHHSSTGFNLEMSMYVAQLTGAYLYTDIPFRWHEIKDTETADEWSAISRSFQTLDFNFLNEVPVEFADEMRKEGRLSGFRDYLRSTYLDVSNGKHLDERNITSYQDRLKHEYELTQNDWQEIDKDLAKWALGRGGLGAIISAGIDWRLSAAGFALEGVNRLIQTHSQRKVFRKNVPLSVFMDLEKRKD